MTDEKTLTLIFVTAILTGIFVSNVSAEDFQWVGDYRTITQIYPDTDFQFYLDGATIDTNSSCPNRFVLRNYYDNYEILVATILAVYQNGDQVKVKFDDDETGCGTTVTMFKAMPE